MNPADFVQQSTNQLIGATIGNYRIVSKLGEGGMGSVYLGEHPLIGKKVAIKVLHDEFVSNADVVSRFFNEAKAVNDIGHPNIVDIVDFGQVQNGKQNFVYFIMEFLAGESIAHLLARESPLPPERALHILMQVADCLRASHAKGIIHRDIKPDNIYLVARGNDQNFVKVLDFGIAKLTGDTNGSRKTRTGIVMGTPAYMSPEQCEGRGNIDHRTDIYALGVVMYEMMTGRVPFLGEGYGEVLVQHLTKVPERPTTIRGAIPPSIEAIVMKTLEKRREDRFQSMEHFVAALRDPEGFASGTVSTVASPAGSAATMMMPSTTSPPGEMRPPVVTGVGAAKKTTTLGEGTGEMAAAAPDEFGEAKRKKTWMWAAAALLIVGGGIATVAATRGGGSKEKPAPIAVTPTDPPIGTTKDPATLPVTDPSVTNPPVHDPVVDVPPAVVKVKIHLESNPSGAEVFLDGKVLGKTPYDHEMDKSAEPLNFVLKSKGFEDAKKSVKADADGNYEVAMKAKAVSQPTRPKTPKKPTCVGDDCTLNPFDTM